MDRDTAARRVRHAAWESCGLLPLLLPAAIPSLMCVVPEWFFDSKDAMGIPAAFLCTAMCVGAWTMIAAVLGLRAARRGLAAAKHHPGLPGEAGLPLRPAGPRLPPPRRLPRAVHLVHRHRQPLIKPAVTFALQSAKK